MRVRTLLHITDIHFGPNHLPDRAEGVAALVAERSPDYVVVSGDLTRRAKPGQFRQARAWVDSLGCQVLAVPGNHDVPMYRVWERVFAPFRAWRRHYSPELEPTLGDDEVSLVGVNSATNWAVDGGSIGAKERRRMLRAFEGAGNQAYRVAVVHHNLIRPPELEDVPRCPAAALGVLRDLAGAGVDMVLGGHAHQSFYARSPVAASAPRSPALLLVAGTATSSRGRGAERGENTCHWIEIDTDGAEVGFCRWSPEQGVFVEERRRRFPRLLEESI